MVPCRGLRNIAVTVVDRDEAFLRGLVHTIQSTVRLQSPLFGLKIHKGLVVGAALASQIHHNVTEGLSRDVYGLFATNSCLQHVLQRWSALTSLTHIQQERLVRFANAQLLSLRHKVKAKKGQSSFSVRVPLEIWAMTAVLGPRKRELSPEKYEEITDLLFPLAGAPADFRDYRHYRSAGQVVAAAVRRLIEAIKGQGIEYVRGKYRFAGGGDSGR